MYKYAGSIQYNRYNKLYLIWQDSINKNHVTIKISTSKYIPNSTCYVNYFYLRVVLGYTNDFHDMLRHLCERHPESKVVIIGYSMGGNIVTKYLGEKDKEKVPNLIGGISICQGYDGIQ